MFRIGILDSGNVFVHVYSPTRWIGIGMQSYVYVKKYNVYTYLQFEMYFIFCVTRFSAIPYKSNLLFAQSSMQEKLSSPVRENC